MPVRKVRLHSHEAVNQAAQKLQREQTSHDVHKESHDMIWDVVRVERVECDISEYKG